MPDTPAASSFSPPRPSPSDIPGWGADLARADRPAYPRERHPPRLPAHAQRQPAQQLPQVEVLHSLERPGLTPVFGSTVPPSGLSGRTRRYAFGFSENDLRHWLLLLLADRIHVVEGLAQDLAQGHVPKLFAEMGWRAEWRYNRPAFIRRLLAAGVVAGVALVAWRATRAAPRRLELPHRR